MVQRYDPVIQAPNNYKMLHERWPMTAIDLVIYIQSRNYRPETDPRVLMQSVSATMGRNPTTFIYRKNWKWAVVPDKTADKHDAR